MSTSLPIDTPLDARIAVVAGRQYGNITRRQLIGLGVSDRQIAYRVRQGHLHRVHRGLYAVGRPPKLALENAMAAVLACGRGALLSHFSALQLWGFGKRWPRLPEVTAPGERKHPQLTAHGSTALRRDDRRVQLGIPVTSPARTILDRAPRLDDRLTRTVNDALHGPFLSELQLAAVIARYPNHAGSRLLAPHVHAEAGRTRSVFEDRFRSSAELIACRSPSSTSPSTDILSTPSSGRSV
jgi:hypothetical protein